MSPLLRVGIIGAGVVAAEIHAPGYLASRHAELVAVASASRASAERLSQQFSIAEVHEDVTALLGDKRIDAVSICTPPATHRALVEAAVAAGKHVLVEKPIATTLGDVDAIRRAAQESEQVVEVVRNERFMQFNVRMREAVDASAVGELLAVLQTTSTTGPEVWAPSAAWFRDRARAGGGSLIDLAVHKADLAGWIAQRPLINASATVLRDTADVEERGLLSFELEGAVHCAIHASWAGPPDQASIVVMGTKGVLSGVWSRGEIACRGATDADWTTPIPWSADDRSGRDMIGAFVDSCLAGERPVVSDPAWDCGTRSVLLGYARATGERA